MLTLSAGKLRGLQQIANARGVLTVCAIDHRESLRQELNEKNPDAVNYPDMVNFKLDLCQIIAPLASAVLLDPTLWSRSGHSFRQLARIYRASR